MIAMRTAAMTALLAKTLSAKPGFFGEGVAAKTASPMAYTAATARTRRVGATSSDLTAFSSLSVMDRSSGAAMYPRYRRALVRLPAQSNDSVTPDSPNSPERSPGGGDQEPQVESDAQCDRSEAGAGRFGARGTSFVGAGGFVGVFRALKAPS